MVARLLRLKFTVMVPNVPHYKNKHKITAFPVICNKIYLFQYSTPKYLVAKLSNNFKTI